MKNFFFCHKAELLSIIIILLLSIPVIIPYFHRGYFPTHDGEWAIVRLSDMYRLARDFQVPPRYSGNLNFGYGYPLFNFAYPFPYYLGLIFKLLGFGFVESIKILFALSVPISGLAMYFLASRVWLSKNAGLISAILFIYLPYRFVDLFVRGSLGESLSFILFPIILLSVLQIYKKYNRRIFMAVLSISFAVLVTTHNIMTVLFLPILLICFVLFLLFKNYKVFALCAFSILIGLGLSMFFWLPAIAEKNYILLSKIPIAERNLYFVKPLQLIIPSWGYGTPTEANSFSYQLGIAQILSCILILIISAIKIKKNKDRLSILALLLITITLVYSFMLFKPSMYLWKILPLFSEINYPWTLLAIFGFLICLASGYIARIVMLKAAGFILVIIAVIITLPYAKPISYVDRGEGFYFTNDATTTSSQELMPLWVKYKPEQRYAKKIEILEGRGEITEIKYNSKKISFLPLLDSAAKIRVNTIYYPGWKAFVDGKEQQIIYDNKMGLMDIALQNNVKRVDFFFGETPLRMFSNLLSVVSFIIICLFVFMPIKIFRNFLGKT